MTPVILMLGLSCFSSSFSLFLLLEGLSVVFRSSCVFSSSVPTSEKILSSISNCFLSSVTKFMSFSKSDLCFPFFELKQKFIVYSVLGHIFLAYFQCLLGCYS